MKSIRWAHLNPVSECLFMCVIVLVPFTSQAQNVSQYVCEESTSIFCMEGTREAAAVFIFEAPKLCSIQPLADVL
uniref:Putative secreted protein n=1 Tax=Rhipicephalus microplus TaxID=6941 RepID=A0A6G5A293_RHIMP